MIRSLEGKTPKIAPSAFVSEAAYVVGDVEIGEGSSIWPGTVIRGDTGSIRIGSKVSIQDNSVVHANPPGLVIGNNIIIGHSVVLHGKKVGNDVLIGNNATVLDEVDVGNNCLIGAGSLVSPNMVIPDNYLVIGVPARIRGQVKPEQAAEIRDGVESYADKGARYKKAGL